MEPIDSKNFPVLTKSIKTLSVKLTDDEFNDRAHALAEVCQEIQTEEKRATDQKTQMKARMTQLEARRSELTSIVAAGEEMRQVECKVFADFEHSQAVECRLDTMKILTARPLTDNERQTHLPLNDDHPPEPGLPLEGQNGDGTEPQAVAPAEQADPQPAPETCAEVAASVGPGSPADPLADPFAGGAEKV